MTRVDSLPVTGVGSLAPMEVASRLPALRARLGEAGCDALLVTKLENVAYLTGFRGSAGMLLVTGSSALLTTDGRYRDQARAQLDEAGVDAELVVGRLGEQLEALERATGGLRRLGLEAASCTWSFERGLAERLGAIELVPTRGVVEALRVVKDAGELARIEAACDIADVALAQVKGRLAEGVTEAEFAAELEFEMRRRGADGAAFETIVASGPNAAMPHARPSARPIGEGELVVVDFGAVVDGYRSDMTRTLCVGEPAPGLAELVDAVFAAQRAGVRAVRAGVRAEEVDAACRRSLEEAGYGEAFLHSTGHGVGLEIHEAPAIAPGSADILLEHGVVTVEPGAYLPGRGGVRIEDTLVVTSNGARALTKTTKDHTL